jgi:CheY-like chemotaxis protein
MPTALIVEDEPEANRLLAMLVELRGFRTNSVFTGSDALASVERHAPDIVFLDLMLPDVNGYEVCKALKSRKATTLIPVVMVTARVAVENRILSYRVGADQYVPKPYTPDQIFRAIEDAGDWARQVECRGVAGEVPFRSRDDGESLRKLAQLRSLLLARTPLDEEATRRLHDACSQLWAAADAWGRKHATADVAALDFSAREDRVELNLRDLSGWFRDDPRSPAERWPEAVARGGFDQIIQDRPGDAVQFVVRFPKP